MLQPEVADDVYDSQTLERIRGLGAVQVPAFAGDRWRSQADVLREADVLFSGWGAPRMDAEFLDNARNLKAVFYAAGSVKHFATDEFWRRGIRLSSAFFMNAIPVCEYTIGAILMGLKHCWHYGRLTRERRCFPVERPVIGGYRAKIGLISYGTIARLVRQRLRAFEMEVIVYDPLLSVDEAAAEGVKLASLDQLFAESDVVSVHAPVLKSTRGLIGRAQFERLKPWATFINTARGELVQEEEMVAFLADRPDVQAVLDVTDPEPPERGSPLYDLPNVLLTPHISGSLGRERARLGEAMADEFERYLTGRPLLWELRKEQVLVMA